MRYTVVLEAIDEPDFVGWYYAHLPTLGLTTHGQGVEGALAAAYELAGVWVAERHARGEPTGSHTGTTLIGHIDLPDAVHGA